MLPWMREKFAERRAKWHAARSKRAATATAAEAGPSTSADEATTVNNPPTNNTPLHFRVPHPGNGTTALPRQQPHSSRNESPARQPPSSSLAPPAIGCHAARSRTPTPRTRLVGVHHQRSPLAAAATSESSSVAPIFLTPQLPTRISKIKRRSSTSSSSNPSSAFGSLNNSDALLGRPPHGRERIKVRVLCPSARLLVFQTDVTKRLAELKNEVILELSDDPTSMPLFATDVRQLSPRYRLFRADYNGAELNENQTLAQLHIGDNDTVVLVARRTQLQQLAAHTRETHAPEMSEIESMTRGVVQRTPELPMVDINEIFQQSNLQFDVRKVLISLAQASALVIGSGPYATRLITMLKQRLVNKRNYQNDTLQCLIDMGFKKEKAEYALKSHNNVYASALEWLLLNQNDDTKVEEAAMGIQKSHSVISPSGIITNDDIVENTSALLEIVRIYSHRDIPPTTEAVGDLVEMGFEEAEVLNALKKTCNNKAAACEWLVGNRSGSLIELRDGLAHDSPILKTIMELPQVQLNLSNPKTFLAFLSILENEQTIRVWGGDNDTTSVITHILQKYHEEKHVLGINQFYSQR